KRLRRCQDGSLLRLVSAGSVPALPVRLASTEPHLRASSMRLRPAFSAPSWPGLLSPPSPSCLPGAATKTWMPSASTGMTLELIQFIRTDVTRQTYHYHDCHSPVTT